MDSPRVGVFVCYCGANINGLVDCEAIKEYALKLDGVEYAETYPFYCSDPGQKIIKKAIEDYKLNRIVVAAYSTPSSLKQIPLHLHNPRDH